MTRDRFHEFQQQALQASPDSVRNGSYIHTRQRSPLRQQTVITVNAEQLAYDSRLDVLAQMDGLRASINRLEERIRALNAKQSGVLAQTVVGPTTKDQLEEVIEEIKNHVRSLRPRIREIDASIREDERSGTRSNAEMRIRRNQCEALKRRLHDVLSLFNNSQNDYKRRVSRRVRRQLELAGEPLSAEDVDRMMESQHERIFYREVNPLTMNGLAALEDATNRHNEILALERSIGELNELFVEIYELVALQDSLVNNIAKNVENAAEYTTDAHQQIKRAVTYKQRAQRKTCILVLICVAVLAAILILGLVLILSR